MGYYLSEIHDTKLGAYIGSATMYAVAEAGAFDSHVSEESEKLADSNDHIFAIVEKSGIEHCLNVLQTKAIGGRDVQLLINEIQQNYPNGFKITE